MRYFLEIAYKGTKYHGWQIQDNAISVQEVLNNTLSELLNENIQSIGSGRTDTGVHALQQFVQIDTEKELSTRKHAHALNGLLPKDIVVNAIFQVDEEINARHHATSREYLYRMIFVKDPFRQNLAAYYGFKPNLGKMNKAAERLVGKKDFSCFSKVQTQVENFVCDIREARWIRKQDEFHFRVRADRFLRGMVRAMVGTMMLAGQDKISPADMNEIIESQDRTKAGPSALPEGLYLSSVKYPEGKLRSV